MRAKAIAAALALGAVAALALPGGALATVGHHRRVGEVSAFFTLRGSHDFEFVVLVPSQYSGVLMVSKLGPGSGSETVSYANVGRGSSVSGLEGREVNLRFGNLGHFRARFVPTSIHSQAPQRGCEGEPTIDEEGVFVGSFDFHGERGYTTLHATRAQGVVTRSGAQRCAEPSRPHHPGREKARRAHEAKEREGEFRLLAGEEGGANVEVERSEGSGRSKALTVTTSAATTERVGSLQISRSASVPALGPAATSILQIPNLADPLAEATLQPPAPFSGSATFALESPKSASWTGDLAVSLPGAAPLPLTGEGIDAGACQGVSNCTKTLPKFLQLTLELTGRGGFSFGGVATTTVGLRQVKKGSR